MATHTSEPGRLESSLRAWLALHCQLIPGVEAALAVLGPFEHPPGVCILHWPSREQVSRQLASTVDFVREHGKLAAREPSHSATAIPGTTEIAAPLTQRGRVIGALGISVRGVKRDERKALVERLTGSIRLLELLLEALGERERLATRFAFGGTLLDHARAAEASHALCADLARRLGCERVSLGLRRRGKLKVLALSSSLRFADETEAIRDLRACMEEAAEQDAVIEMPLPAEAPPHVTRAHEQLLRSSGAGAVRTVPLAALGQSAGALTCEWSPTKAVDAALRGVLQDAAVLCGPILELMSRAEADAIERARGWLGRFAERHFAAHPGLTRGVLGALAAVLVGLAVAPGGYRVSARATLEGRVQRALVAAANGYIEEANVRAGDLVRAGDVLARLDDRDLRLEERKLQGQLARLQTEQREALAGEDRAHVSILQAQIDQAAAELGLAEEQLERTSVVAPFDGVILEGDLQSSLGSPVDRGAVLFELAPLDGYRIILKVDDRDIADVAVGQRGRLALSALPGQRLPLAVERITPMSTAEEGRHYFRVEAVLEQPSEALRPGMEGIAKIDVGRRRLLWIWTHEMLDWLRLWTWSFLP